MKKKLNFAIIGCGRISYKHVEALINNNAEAKLVSVCDVILNKAEDKKNQYIEKVNSEVVTIYSDYKEMIEKESIDVVTIATESGYHADIAIYCMQKGKHVIVEKPMALSIENAKKMIDISKKFNVKLVVCHQNRFNPSIQKLRYVIESNGFGKIINGTARILWNRNDAYYQQAPWRGTWNLDGGTLMNQCIHNIDLLQWMLGGEIETVYSQSRTFLRNIEAEDFGTIIIKFKNNSIGIVEGSACVYPKNLEETLSVFGEIGTVCIGGLAVNKIETWNFQNTNLNDIDLTDQEVENVYGKGHIPLFKNVIDSINNDAKPLIDGEEGIKALSIILASYKSRLTGIPITFPLEKFSTLDMINIKK